MYGKHWCVSFSENCSRIPSKTVSTELLQISTRGIIPQIPFPDRRQLIQPHALLFTIETAFLRPCCLCKFQLQTLIQKPVDFGFRHPSQILFLSWGHTHRRSLLRISNNFTSYTRSTKLFRIGRSDFFILVFFLVWRLLKRLFTNEFGWPK